MIQCNSKSSSRPHSIVICLDKQLYSDGTPVKRNMGEICKSSSRSWISIFASVRLVLLPSDECHFLPVDFWHISKKDAFKLVKPKALSNQAEDIFL